MNAFLSFSFAGHLVRAMGDQESKAWFVGKDICKILGFKNPNKAMADHCLESQRSCSTQTPGGMQEARVLGPIDVLQLVRRSTLSVPQGFESWLLQEVLPALYKSGASAPGEAHQAQLDQVKSILEISDAVIESGVSARKSISVALARFNAQKSAEVEPFRDRIMAQIAAREIANNEASSEQVPVAKATHQPENQARNPMTNMTIFTFEGHPVRAMGDQEGKAWFVGKDICKILGFQDHGKAMSAHCLGEANFRPVETSGGTKEARVLSPIDVLQLMRRSTLPVPQGFESWLLQEVLPALYKSGASAPGEAHQAQLDQVKSILEISDAVIKSGVSARKSLTVALDLIHAQTGIAVTSFKDLLRGRITKGGGEVNAGESNSPAPTKALQTGDLNEADVQSWQALMALPAHERFLKLTWLAGTKTRAAVLWHFCEMQRRKAAVGFAGSAFKVSANDIAEKSFVACSVSGVRAAMSDLIDEGLLHALPHVDNVTRKIWLDWAALHSALQSTRFPELIFLELNWVAKNKAEMVVLHALTVATNQAVSKLSPSALVSQYRAKVDIDASALTRAVKSLLAAEMIEQVDASDSRCVRLVPGRVEKLLEQFYLTDLQRLPG